MATDNIGRNLARVKDAVAAAEAAASRTGQTRLVAAVKYATDEQLAALLALGVTDVGENRVQQLLAHYPQLEEAGVRVHLIGTLQKNKVKYLVGKVETIQSLDSEELAAEIEKQYAKAGCSVRVLVEINSGREAAKSGVLPETALALCRAVLRLPHLTLCGFMTMGPRCETEQEYRAYFKTTRELAHAIWRQLGLAGAPLLSMGMSESFTAAIAEGADMVRVGRTLFQE